MTQQTAQPTTQKQPTPASDIPQFKVGALVLAHFDECGKVIRQEGFKVWLEGQNYWWHALNLRLAPNEQVFREADARYQAQLKEAALIRDRRLGRLRAVA